MEYAVAYMAIGISYFTFKKASRDWPEWWIIPACVLLWPVCMYVDACDRIQGRR
jgi:hypothetical protein